MKIKVAELTGEALNWAVANAAGVAVKVGGSGTVYHADCPKEYSPSTNWSQGGPIIEREHIDIEHHRQSFGDGIPHWHAMHPKNKGGLIRCYGYGPTALVAAMRCFVVSKLGEEVDLPAALNKKML